MTTSRKLEPDEVFRGKAVRDREIPASALSGEHLDKAVRFKWRFPTSQVQAVVTGVLREVHHDGAGRVYVHLIPADADALEVGWEKEEFPLLSDAVVAVL